MADLKDKTVLMLGAGPRVIGQSAECDEGATEAALALATQGCRIIAVNSNPDTIMTISGAVFRSYLEPLTIETLSKIVETEKPDALLPAYGGRQGLHLAAELHRAGVLDKCQISLWRLSSSTVEQVLNRDTLNGALNQIGLNTPPIFEFNKMEAAAAKAQELGFPLIFRHTDTHRMPDGVLVYNQDELRQHALPGGSEGCSPIFIEASLLTWQQVELEILRDRKGTCIIVGGIEYLDTAGIHPGDALAVCPIQNLSTQLIQQLIHHAKRVADHLDLVGNATIRFAFQPADGELYVLAVHPRYTRSSAFISRVMHFPLAALAGLLSAGYTLNNLPSNFSSPPTMPEKAGISDSAPVGVKWPAWDFERLKASVDRLGPQMQAVGQNAGYGLNFKEAFQKAFQAAYCEEIELKIKSRLNAMSLDDILFALSTPSSHRVSMVLEALRHNTSVDKLVRITSFAPWFVHQLYELVDIERQIANHKGQLPPKKLLVQAKKAGFANRAIAGQLQLSVETIERQMAKAHIQPGRRTLSTSASQLHFTTYGGSDNWPVATQKKNILIIGSGAYRIGQGPECDYGIFQAVQAITDLGYHPVVLNPNLLGITSSKTICAECYGDPVTKESIVNLLNQVRPYGAITQFAGEQAYTLTTDLTASGARLLGTPISSQTLVTNRVAFRNRLHALGIPQPAGAVADCEKAVMKIATQVGYPVLIHSIGTNSDTHAELLQTPDMLTAHLAALDTDNAYPMLVEQFLEYAIEAQAEVLCDGQSSHVAAVLEHIELAGVHAGDSACVLPPYSIAPRHMDTISAYCQKVATALAVKGLINLRFAIYRDTVYLLDAAFNTCRNLAVVNRVHQLPLADFATRLMLGGSLKDLSLSKVTKPLIGVRAAVFPFDVFSAEDPLLGPQMRSIGQVVSLADSFGLAYFKAQSATAAPLPTCGTVLITVTDEDKTSILEPARIFHEMGFKIMATKGTHHALATNGIESFLVRKLGFGRPNLLDEIKNGHVQMVINTPTGGQGQIDDSVIRRTAITYGVAVLTTPASALAAAKGIAAQKQGKDIIRALPDDLLI